MGLNDLARRWELRLFGGRRGLRGPRDGASPARIAQRIFERDMGGAVPTGRLEMLAMVRRSGAVPVLCAGLPAAVAGLHSRGTIYVSEALSRPERRRVLMQLWARYLCWRDRGGPATSVYERTPGDDPYSRVAGLFEQFVVESDPVQPRREPTLY